MNAAPANAGSQRPLWLAAAGVPVIAHAASVVVNVEPSSWGAMPPALRHALAPDALLYVAGAALVAAPIAGVSLAARSRLAPGAGGSSWRVAALLLGAVLLFTAVSAAVTFGWAAGRHDALVFVVRSHVTLSAVALALAAWGALCGTVFRDPLDAAAVSLGLAILAAVGLLLGGASVADLPRPVVGVALAASPIVAVAAAAHIDIVRMDLLYQISPLAHMQMEYPAWHSASGGYLAVALTCFLAFTWSCRTWSPASRS